MDAHDIKIEFLGPKNISKYDLYKHTDTGEIQIFGKGGKGDPIFYRILCRLTMKDITTQIKLIFIIFGAFFDPRELSHAINITPTNSWKKGDEIVMPKGVARTDGRKRLRQESGWEYSTGFIQTLDFEDLSIQFQNAFEKHVPEIKLYIQKNNLECSINVVVEMLDGQIPSIHFNRKILQLAHQLSSEIDVDMYLLSNK